MSYHFTEELSEEQRTGSRSTTTEGAGCEDGKTKRIGILQGKRGKVRAQKRGRVPSPNKDPGPKSYRRKGGEPSSDKQRNRATHQKEESLRSRKPQLNSSPPEERASNRATHQKVELLRSRKPQLNSSPPEERASEESLRGELSQPFDSHPKGRRHQPTGEKGEKPSSTSESGYPAPIRKRATYQKEESLRSGQPQLYSYPPDGRASEGSLRSELSQPLDSHPPDERTSAFMHSERLREATVQKDKPREGRRHQPTGEKGEKPSSMSESGYPAPTNNEIKRRPTGRRGH
jgi:hypothetical protein